MPHPCRNVTDETVASEQIESYYHVPDFGLLRQSHHEFYLVTTRDPFQRVVSAFVFEHIRNRDARKEKVEKMERRRYEDAYECFPTLERYVDFLRGNSKEFHYPYKRNMVVANSCQDLARAAFHGHVRIYHHFYFTYERIKSLIPDAEKQVIFVTRQDQLWDDWTKINQLLGQTTPIRIPTHFSQTKIRNITLLELRNELPVTRELSAEGTETLCQALQDEYEAYFWFLKRARNLDDQDILASLEYSRNRCPHLRIDLQAL
jgi:hypothetical protein